MQKKIEADFKHHNYGGSIEELERKQRDMKIFAKKLMRGHKISKAEQVTIASVLIGAGRVAARIEFLKNKKQSS